MPKFLDAPSWYNSNGRLVTVGQNLKINFGPIAWRYGSGSINTFNVSTLVEQYSLLWVALQYYDNGTEESTTEGFALVPFLPYVDGIAGGMCIPTPSSGNCYFRLAANTHILTVENIPSGEWEFLLGGAEITYPSA